MVEKKYADGTVEHIAEDRSSPANKTEQKKKKRASSKKLPAGMIYESPTKRTETCTLGDIRDVSKIILYGSAGFCLIFFVTKILPRIF